MLEHIIGQKDQVEELKRIAAMWRDPARYRHAFEMDVPHVILLVGAEGSGKSTIADAFIKETGLRSVRPDEREFPQDFQGWVQHTVATAMSIAAPNLMGAVALIEDLDRRLPLAESSSMGSPTEIFEFEMGVPKEHGLVFVTARSESPLKPLIDKGCFDKIVRLQTPTVRENERIFDDILAGRPCEKIDCAVISSLLHGKTTAHLEQAYKMATEAAYAKGYCTVSTEFLVDACLRLAYDAHEITQKDKVRLIASAYHEAGHTIVEEVLRPGSVAVASVKTYYSGVTGVTCEMYPDERWDTDLDHRINIRAILAGKAAVQAKLKVTDIGATYDIKMAKFWESRRVEKYEANGFRDLHTRAKDVGGTGTLSDDFDRKARSNLATEYSEVVKFFSYDCVKECLDAVARALMSEGTLLGEDVRSIMAEHPIDKTCIVMFQIEQ